MKKRPPARHLHEVEEGRKFKVRGLPLTGTVLRQGECSVRVQLDGFTEVVMGEKVSRRSEVTNIAPNTEIE